MVINSKTCSCKNSKHFTQYCAGFCGYLEIVRCCACLIELCGPAPAHPVRSCVRRKVDPNRGALGVFPSIPETPSKKSISSFHSPGLTSNILIIIANLLHFDNLFRGGIFGKFVAIILFECPQVTIEKELHLRLFIFKVVGIFFQLYFFFISLSTVQI